MSNLSLPLKGVSRISPDAPDSSFFSLKNNSNKDFSTSNEHSPSYIPPWNEPYIIGVGGTSGSGKTSVSQKIIQELNQPWTVLLSFDNFYKTLSEEEIHLAFENEYDYDTPESLDLDLLVEVVKKLKKGERATIPIYSFELHSRTNKTTTIYGANVIIIEGIFTLYDKRLTDLMDLKIYVDTDLDICLARRLNRDIVYRGRDLAGAMKQWSKFVKPNAVRHVIPTMNNADLVIPRGLDNSIAIDFMIKHVQKQLKLKSAQHLKHLKYLGVKSDFVLESYPNVQLLADTNQTRGINSIIFEKSTERSDFIFYFDRISSLIVEKGIDFLNDYENVDIVTPENQKYQGIVQSYEIVAVNVIRSGDCFMTSLKRTFPDISIGKLLIQSNSLTGEPQLHTESLPHDLRGKKIFLSDAQIISGAAAIMAVQVLLDHKVQQSDIILCSYLSTEIGLRRILSVFPSINIVIGKLSVSEDDSTTGKERWYNRENFKDNDWHFRNRFIDNLYFGTE